MVSVETGPEKCSDETPSLQDHKKTRPPFNPLEGCAWPDPDPSPEEGLFLDDVSQMNATPVERLWFPRCEQDVVQILQSAWDHNKRISIRGTQHSMGGQSLCPDGYVVDTKYLNHMRYDPITERLTCGVGCTWADIIPYLDQYLKSPKVLQSYCTFSVGGTLAVNAHGITSDHSLASCVHSFRLVRYESDSATDKATSSPLVQVVECHRPETCTNKSQSEEELFGLALGGYGLFGVITQVTLEVTDNTDLQMDSLVGLRLEGTTSDDPKSTSEFVHIWDACRNDPTVEIKLARMNILTLETASLHVFRRGYGPTMTMNLPLQPRELSPVGRLLYKWALPILKDYRHSSEERSGQAVDMPHAQQDVTRNEVLWESALPLAKLYSPLVVVEDTFVLQEYFVPHDEFEAFIKAVRPIYQEMDTYQREGSLHGHAQSLILLNTTIRYVEQDETTVLSYNSKPGGMFAFVLYFRIKRKQQVKQDLDMFHNRLAEVAVRLGGTFYLPYRKCYGMDLLQRAYPQIEDFAAKKEMYDVLGMFSNHWFEEFVLQLCSSEYQEKWKKASAPLKLVSLSRTLQASKVLSEEDFLAWLPRWNDPMLERRTNSYRTLLKNKLLRKKFAEEFLVNVFNIADPAEVMRVMSKAAWDPRNEDDLAIFRVIRDHFHGPTATSAARLKRGWRALKQLSQQKSELTHETAIILNRLGLFGRIRGYLSIGDHGKTVRSFRAAGLLDPQGDTQVFVAHNFHPQDDEVSMSVILERGSMEPVGDAQIQYDYIKDNASDKLTAVKSDSMDLVTLNQGLHHFPQAMLYPFLCEIRRVLRRGGIFIFREHDLRLNESSVLTATNTPVPMLDLAHSVFNAVTGVSDDEEASEIRAFRSLSEWRSVLEKVGFTDTLLYGLERGDSTCDFMMCFSKGEIPVVGTCACPLLRPLTAQTTAGVISDDMEPPVMGTVRMLLAQIPATVTGAVVATLEMLLEKLPAFKEHVSAFLLVDFVGVIRSDEKKRQGKAHGGASGTSQSLVIADTASSLCSLIEGIIQQKIAKVNEIASGAKNLLEDVKIRETSNIAGLLSMPELFLILPVLKRMTLLNPEKVGELETVVIGMVEKYFPALLQVGGSPESVARTPPSATTDSPSGAPRTVRSVRRAVPEGASEDSGHNTPVDSNDVMRVILELGNHIPGLLDPAVVLADSGLTLTQQSALFGALMAPDLPSFAENVAWYHDQASWKELRWIVVGEGSAEMSSVAQSKDLPTKDLLLSKKKNHPWHRAFKAFLRGPRVRLKQQALFGLRFLGLSDMIALYEEAKRENTLHHLHTTQDTQLTTELDFTSSKRLNLAMREIDGQSRLKEVRIQFDGSNKEYDLFDVGEVVKAEFGYKSLTSNLTDLTHELRSVHADIHEQISLERAKRDEMFRPRFANWNSEQLTPARPPVGWLPIREEMLVGFRNKGTTSRMADSLRKVVVGTGTIGMAGNNVLKMTYVPLQTEASGNELQVAGQLCEFLEDRNLIKRDLHPNDGHYTWFKLSEWMQVEIMDLFAKSLDHTPWYQFPFLEYLSTYFRILFKECKIVSTEHSLLEAYASMAFATDFIPGVVMMFLFAQLQLLGYPLKLSLPMYNPDDMVEEIVMTSCCLPSTHEQTLLSYLRTNVDERIRDASTLFVASDECGMSLSGLYRIVVPTFKPMGEILVKLGERIPSARVLQISNQVVVQTVVSVLFGEPSLSVASKQYLEQLVSEIDSIDGLQVMFQYRYPMDHQMHRDQGELVSRVVHLSIKAQVTSLLALVRLVARLDRVSVKQIYDFWSG